MTPREIAKDHLVQCQAALHSAKKSFNKSSETNLPDQLVIFRNHLKSLANLVTKLDNIAFSHPEQKLALDMYKLDKKMPEKSSEQKEWLDALLSISDELQAKFHPASHAVEEEIHTKKK